MKTRISYFLLFSLLNVLIGCNAGGLQAETALRKSIKVGGLFILSGSAGLAWGETERNSFLLAVKDFERSHPNTAVEVQIEDSAYSNAKSVTAFQKLTAVDGVKYVIGPTWETVVANIPLCESKHVVCLAPSTNNGAFDDARLKYTFSAWFDERNYSAVHADFLKQQKFRKVALVSAISPYYDSLHEALLRSMDLKPVFSTRLQPEERDFRTIIARIPAEVEALAVFLLGDGAAQNFFRQWADLRADRPLILTDDAHLYFEPPLNLRTLGFRVRYSVPDLVSSNRLTAFDAAYREAYRAAPAAPSGAVAYDLTLILLECAAKWDPLVEQVRDCISGTDGYEGASGTLSFDGGRVVRERKMKVLELE